MNERIKELVIQARNYALDEKRIYERMHNTEQSMEEYRNVYNEKFAELIVKECAKVCLAQRDPSNLNYKPSERFAEAVKQHFGVEDASN